MTENKRFISSGNWIKDNNIDRLLNIDFNTTIDRDMCCKLLNQLEDKKSEYVKISDKYFEENKQLKEENKELEKENEQLKQLLDLFASDICKVTELLDDNNIEYELYNDVENFIVKWGVRIE